MRPLFAHQEEGVRALMRLTDPERGRVAPGCLMLAFEMRLGKTRTVVEAAQRLHAAGELDQVVVVCPAPVRGVWADEATGQVAAWSVGPVTVTDLRSKAKTWHRRPTTAGVPAMSDLSWTVISYELLRRPERLKAMVIAVRGWKRDEQRTMLVVDESSYVSSPSAAQTRAVHKLRQACDRVVELNGTPEGDDPGDLYAQMKILDPAILGFRTWYEYRDRHAVVTKDKIFVKGKEREFQRVVSWKDLDELGRRTAPYVLRKLAREAHDMPEQLDPVTITATLSPTTWRIYKEMRDDAVAWLSANDRCVAAQAAVKVLRLSQVTSGFLGGVAPDDLEEGDTPPPVGGVTAVVGSEKHDLVLGWLRDRWREDPKFKVVVWCRFRAEAERLAASVRRDEDLRPLVTAALLVGNQRSADRQAALALLDPRSAGPGGAAVFGTARTGGMGLDLSAAACTVYASNDYSRTVRVQSMARTVSPDAVGPRAYYDVVAEGPDGQRTVDHVVMRALTAKVDLARITAREWLRELEAT